MSAICCGLLVAGITQVTAGFARMNFSNICAQFAQPISGGPVRQAAAVQAPEQTTATEWAVHQDRDAAFGGERQQALFGGTIVQRVVQLDKIELFRPHHCFELVIARSACSG